eukprot:1160909-Pelagomonas_calceolata.AAC.11
MATKKPKPSDLVQKSPAEFFAENKNIAGFDNVGASPGAVSGIDCALVGLAFKTGHLNLHQEKSQGIKTACQRGAGGREAPEVNSKGRHEWSRYGLGLGWTGPMTKTGEGGAPAGSTSAAGAKKGDAEPAGTGALAQTDVSSTRAKAAGASAEAAGASAEAAGYKSTGTRQQTLVVCANMQRQQVLVLSVLHLVGSSFVPAAFLGAVEYAVQLQRPPNQSPVPKPTHFTKSQ